MVDNNQETDSGAGIGSSTRRGALATFGTAAGVLLGTSGMASAQSGGLSISVDPDPPTVGDETTFTGNAAFVDEWRWFIARPDGTMVRETGQTVTVTFEQTGNYSAGLFAKFSDGEVKDVAKEGTIEESGGGGEVGDPVANIEYSPQDPVYNPITFDGSNSNASGDEIISYDWYLTEEGTSDEEAPLFEQAPSVSGETFEESFSVGDTWTVGLEVTNSNGDTGRDSVTVSPVADSPVAVLNYSPQDPVYNPITFDASESMATDEIVSYDWYLTKEGSSAEEAPLFEQNPSASGETFEESFVPGDTWLVGLEITDSNGDTGRDSVTISPVADGPVAVLNYSPQDPVFNPITFDASESMTTDEIVSYDWYHEKGGDVAEADLFAGQSTAAGETFEESYAAGTTWTVGVEVANSNGDIGRDFVTVSPIDKTPTAVVEQRPDEVTPPNPVTLDASGSTTPVGEIVSYEWVIDKHETLNEKIGTIERSGAVLEENWEAGILHIYDLTITTSTGETATVQGNFRPEN